MIIPLGIGAFVVFYLVFYFMIGLFDLKTPGREDDEEDYAEVDKDATLSNNDFTTTAEKILEGLGGRDNITSADYCTTRLRLEVVDHELVNEKALKAAGAAGVIRPGKTSVQVVIGTKVQFVYDELKKML
jgi:PTS system N-acetylglucosamine-specific IIC component